MKIQIGYGEFIYGTVENTPGGLRYAGSNVDAMKSIIGSIPHGNGQSDEKYLAELPDHLNDRVWARDATGEKKAEVRKPRTPPGPPTWREGPQIPPKIVRQLKAEGRIR